MRKTTAMRRCVLLIIAHTHLLITITSHAAGRLTQQVRVMFLGLSATNTTMTSKNTLGDAECFQWVF